MASGCRPPCPDPAAGGCTSGKHILCRFLLNQATLLKTLFVKNTVHARSQSLTLSRQEHLAKSPSTLRTGKFQCIYDAISHYNTILMLILPPIGSVHFTKHQSANKHRQDLRREIEETSDAQACGQPWLMPLCTLAIQDSDYHFHLPGD